MKMRTIQSLVAASLLMGLLATAGTAAAGPTPATGLAASRPAHVFAQVAPAAIVPVDLCATNGSITMPDGVSVPVWGYVETTSCGAGMITDANWSGSPVIRAVAGDTVVINLTNALAVTTSVEVPGQTVSATGGTPGTFATEVAAGGSASYSFTAKAGTYLYESATNAGIQIPMGLAGAVAVADVVGSGTDGRAYAGAGTVYDVDAVVLLSEIDPALNANPGGFDLEAYHPTYFLMNGRPYPDTADVTVGQDDRLLVRWANASFHNQSMAVLGAHQRVIAKEGYEVPNPFDAVAEIVPAGATADVLIDTTGLAGPFPLYNRNTRLTNADWADGGMLMYVEIGVPPVVPAVTIAAPTEGASVDGTESVEIGSDPSITVEWSTDNLSWQPTIEGPAGTYTATWDTTTASEGLVTLYARASADGATNWGVTTTTVTVANAPSVSFTPLDDAVLFGDAVAILITANDPDGVGDVSWSVVGGPSDTMGGTDYDSTFSTIGLPEGPATINVTATDTLGHTRTVSHVVEVSNLPTGGIVSPTEGQSIIGVVSIEIDASDAEDAVLTVTWDVDGGIPQAATHDSGSAYTAQLDTGGLTFGGHTLHVSIEDSRGNVATDTVNVTVTPPDSVHIGDLDGTSAAAGGPNRRVTIRVLVHDADHDPVDGASVWLDIVRTPKNGGTALDQVECVAVGGWCNYQINVNSNQFENTLTATVTDITTTNGLTYNDTDNEDPEVELASPDTVTVGW